jgi:hypothetical protein
MATKVGTLITNTGQAGPSGATGPSGPSGASGAPGATGPSGASGAPGDSGGGGGGGTVAIYLDTPMQISHFHTPVTPIFDPIGLAPGTIWEYATTIYYSCNDTSAQIYFAPGPFTADLKYLSMDGELYYTLGDTTWPAKRFPMILTGIIGTGADLAPPVTLEAADTLYQVSIRWRVLNTGTDVALVTATCQLETHDATVTIGANSVLSATPVVDYAVSSTSGTTVT